MLRLLIVIIFISLVIAPSTAQPTNPPITPDNIAQLEEQHVLGRGSISSIAYTPDGEYLLVDTPLGLWRYDAQDLSAEPELLPATGRFLGYYLDGRYMVFLQQPNTLHILDGQTESLLYELALGDENNRFDGFSADGRHLISSYYNQDSRESYYDVWELASEQKQSTFNYISFSESLLIPENTRMIVPSPHDNNEFMIWDRITQTLSPTFTGEETLYLAELTFSPDGTRFSVLRENNASLWDVEREINLAELIPPQAYYVRATNKRFTPDSNFILVTGDYHSPYFGDSNIYIFDAITGEYIQFLLSARTTSDLIFSPDGEYLITHWDESFFNTLSKSNGINIWHIETWENAYRLEGSYRQIIFNPNGQDMLTDYHVTVNRYDLSTGNFLDALEAFYGYMRQPQNSIIFSPDDSLLLTQYGKIRLWNTQTGELVHEFANENGGIHFRFSPSGQYLMNVTYRTKINVWDLAKNELLYTTLYNEEIRGYFEANDPLDPSYDWYISHQNPDFSPDGETYFTTYFNDIYLRDTLTGELLHQQDISEISLIEKARFNPTGTHITVITETGMIGWWNSDTWTADVVITDATFPTISPDGRYVAYGVNNEIHLFDTQTGENRLFNATYRARITYLAFSEDGQHLYSGTEGEISKWWNIETGSFVTTDYHMDTNGNGLALVSCQVDEINRYCLINTTTQESIFTFMGHVGSIPYARFNHAGTQIVTTGSDGTIRLWGIGD